MINPALDSEPNPAPTVREAKFDIVWTSKAKRKIILCEGKFTVSEEVPEDMDSLEEAQQKEIMTAAVKRCIEKLRVLRANDAARSQR